MLVEFNVQTLLDNNLTADQFLICVLIYEKKIKLLEKYFAKKEESYKIELISSLQKLDFITNLNIEGKYDFNNFIVGTSFAKAMSKGDYFDDLMKTFPVSVMRPDGSKDYLRTDLPRCRKKYASITHGTKMIHDHILKCLQYEVDLRNKEGRLGFMKRLPNWLASEEWKSYEQRMLDDSLSGETKEVGEKYGTRLE